MAKKKPGAQPGNRNALKHGFYSTAFKNRERRLLDQMMPALDLSAEIELIRVTNQRFLQALNASRDELDFETQLAALRAVNLSAQSITSLLRAQALAATTNRDTEDLLQSLSPASGYEGTTPH